VHATRPESALLYRLLGDSNPLHADPAVARAAGFERPILHGLATYGVAAHALLRQCGHLYPGAHLRALDVRFTSPVYPGETLHTEIWRQGSQLQFQTRVVGRDVVVLSHGWAEFA
jgi:acyl dehydratase